MPVEVTLPPLGEGIAGGDIVNLLVKEGDVVEVNQPILEIETGKSVAEIPSTSAGRLVRFSVKVGEHAKVGAPLFVIEGAANGTAPAAENKKTTAATAAPAAEKKAPAESTAAPAQATPAASAAKEKILLPALGEGIAGGDIVNVLVKVGDTVEEGQPLLEIETGKSVAEIPAPRAGKILSLTAQAGTHVKVGAELAEIETSSAAAVESKAAAPAAATTPAPTAPTAAPAQTTSAAPAIHTAPAVAAPAAAKNGALIPAGPATRRFARELGIDLSRVTGTGPGGRISKDDVKAFVRSGAATAGTATGPVQPPLPDFSKYGEIEIKPLPSLRRKIAEQMQISWAIPMVTQFDQADITDLETFRKKYAPQIKEAGGALTVTAFAVQACVDALKAYPAFNSSIDLAGGRIIEKKHYHIGIAVDTENGLIVPVIKDADRKSLREISVELSQIAAKARARKVTPADLEGATFTISNLGGIGGTNFTPLVNSPQVGILGLSRGAMQPVWNGSGFIPRLLMPLSVSYDHRVVDGAQAARFTRKIVESLEGFASRLLG